jgi:hypothetical protein
MEGDMETMPILPETEVEATAALHLGRLLFVFGQMELNLALALLKAQPDEGAERAIVRVEHLSFDDKLREFEALVLQRHADDAPVLARWRRWFAAAHALCKLKNNFAHGRWGFQNMQQQIVHVSHLPGSPNQTEVRYTLAGFAARVAEAEDVAEEFCALTDLSRVDPGHRTVTKGP